MSERLRTATRWVLLIATCLAWFAYVAPASLGGRTGYIVIAGTSMEPGLHTGDVVVVRERPGTYRKGDVVAYPVPAGQVGEGQIVIHRVIAGSGSAGLVLQGDNRTTSDLWRPTDRDVVGVAVFDVPKVVRRSTQERASPLLSATCGGVSTFHRPTRG